MENSVIDDDEVPVPLGELALQTIAMPADANFNGDIFGGWLVSQMDLACAVTARTIARGRVATVAIDSMAFLRPVPIGSVVSCYTELNDVGRSSMKIQVEVWIRDHNDHQAKVTEGTFTFVAIDETGRTRPVPQD
jgi:acyl-CoA thioesterase YciA